MTRAEPGDCVIEEKINQAFGDEEPKGFASGWWSGIVSAFCGFLSFGSVLCLHFPQLLTAPEMRPHYSMPVIRALIQIVIVVAVVSGLMSVFLRRRKILGFNECEFE